MNPARSVPTAPKLTLVVSAAVLVASVSTAWAVGATPSAWSPVRVLSALGLIALTVGAATAAALHWVRQPTRRLAAHLLEGRHELRTIEDPALAGSEAQPLADAFNEVVQAQHAREMQRRHALAGLSHDLRKPLTRLQMRAAIALPEGTTQLMDADFDVMDRLIFQVGRLTSMDASAYRAGQMMPLLDIVEQVVARYRDLDDVRIEVELPQGSPHESPQGSPRYPDLALDRVLGNLIDNALEHGEAPVEVRVEIASESSADREADTIRLLVFDRGRGIDPVHRASLQSRLARADVDTLVRGARGMGLSIVEQIARQLGGELLVLPYDGYRSAVGVLLPWMDSPLSGRSGRTAGPGAAAAAPRPAPHRTS